MRPKVYKYSDILLSFIHFDHFLVMLLVRNGVHTQETTSYVVHSSSYMKILSFFWCGHSFLDVNMLKKYSICNFQQFLLNDIKLLHHSDVITMKMSQNIIFPSIYIFYYDTNIFYVITSILIF